MKLLMIDQDKEINQTFSTGLRQEGYLVDYTNQIKKGVWMAKTNYYDAIVLAAKATSLLNKITKEIASNCPQSFIVVSFPFSSLEKRINLFESGADEILDCKSSFQEFLLKIRILLKREKNPQEQLMTLEVDDLKIHPENFKVERGGKEIQLRKKEFDLLCYFYKNKDRILSRPTLLENVWDSNADFFTNTLEVHILNLRRKIDFSYPKKRKLIQTVHGRGYRFGLPSSLSEGA